MKVGQYAIAVFLLAAGSGLADELLVGRSADPAKWKFIGVHTYAPLVVQSQLADDFELQSHGQPSGPAASVYHEGHEEHEGIREQNA